MLRRVDWRFLAGPPEPERVYCPVRGELGDAVRHIADTVVRDPEPGACDLVVLRDPTSATLRRAVTALGAGGSAYVEWWVPRPRGVAAARRRLAAAGLEDVHCFWPWPPPLGRTPLFWIPVEAPEVVNWFLERHARNHAGACAAAIRSGWRALWRHGALVPLCTTARKPPVTRADVSSLPGLLAQGNAGWELFNGARACALLTGGRSPRNKLVALGFSAGCTDPTVVVKMARVPEAGPPLEHEAAILEAVHARRSVGGVPRLVGRATVAGRAVVAESYISGRPLSEVLRAATHRELALQVTDLLAALATDARTDPVAGSKSQRVASALEALPPQAREQASAALVRLDELPALCEHRDCSPWNVLAQSDGRVALLDWESAEAAGLPVLDLVYFLAYAAFFVEGTMHTRREPSSYRRMLDPSTPVGRVYDECMRRYCAATSVADAAVPSLRLLCWLTHARSAQALQAAGPTGQSARLDARLFLDLAREELASAG
jgi:aminoglycoside phosphotransferase (APT) family kinase protein